MCEQILSKIGIDSRSRRDKRGEIAATPSHQIVTVPPKVTLTQISQHTDALRM